MAKVSLVQGGKIIKGGDKAGAYSYNKESKSYMRQPTGQVLGASTVNETIKAEPSPLLKDLSVGLSKGQSITQENIDSARRSGASLLAPASSGSSSLGSRSSSIPGNSQNPSSNQTGIGGGGKRYSRYGYPLDEEPLVDTPNYDEIQKNLMRDAQKEINSLYKYEKSLLGEQKTINEENLRQNAAMNTLSGLAGSSEANRTTQQVTDKNQAANEKLRAQVQVEIQSVLSNVRKDAQNMYQFERQMASADAKTRVEMQEQAYTRAKDSITLLAGSGATAEGYAQTDPEGYQYLAQQMGGEDMLKAMFTLNRPQEQIVDKKMEGGKYIVAYQNPLDGKLRIETVDLGLPPEYTKTIDAGDRILAIPDGWTGDPSELITINKGLTPSQQMEASPSENGGIYDVLDFRTANAVISQADKFGSSDIVKRFNNIQDARNNIALIDSKTKNPADHQAIVYYFAKALDPESVVREGEYETIKKYSQNVFSRYRGEIENAIDGSGFLSDSAIQNIKETIENRYQSGSVQYQNKQKEASRIINTIAGKDVAGMVLQDYGAGEVSTPTSSSGVLRSPDGTMEVSISDLSPSELEEARNAGWQ